MPVGLDRFLMFFWCLFLTGANLVLLELARCVSICILFAFGFLRL